MVGIPMVLLGVMMQLTPSIPAAGVNQHIVQQVACQFAEPGMVVSEFMTALEGGELSVFDREMTPAMLTPIRVEFTCPLADFSSLTELYSELREPIQVPWRDAVEVRGLSVIMNSRGEILETELHLWPTAAAE